MDRRSVPLLGAGLLFLSSFCGAGCGGGAGEASELELEGARALGLPSGSRLHRITLGGRGSEEHILPQRITVVPGDAVEFLTVDHRIHTISFLPDSLPPGALAFLTSAGTVASPPLISRGTRFLVRLDGAPPGLYPYSSRGHGGEVFGVIELISPEDTTDQERN